MAPVEVALQGNKHRSDDILTRDGQCPRMALKGALSEDAIGYNAPRVDQRYRDGAMRWFGSSGLWTSEIEQ
jgi:hypothetical protein